mmetsp:Transcript_44584/g.127892  ORF Transcript_44584/g.127892 Transcript_44584/m.127892 type:complete len:272 (-) Transcript_44584:2-817(-)
MGIGSVGSTYGPWVSKALAEEFPDVEVCVVELPGHGTNLGEPLGSVEDAATALEAQIRRCHFGAAQDRRPLALFGFSMGANVMYCLAGKLGAACRKLYVAGRAPPHLPAPIRDQQSPQVAKVDELLRQSDLDAVAEALLKDVLPLFMEETQLKTYGRILENRLQREDGRRDVERFARSLVNDCRIGMDSNEVPRNYAGDLHFFHSLVDQTWPPSVEGLYDDLPSLWQQYTTGTFTMEEVAPVSHHEFGGVNSPILKLMLKDIAHIAKEGRL